MKLSRTFSNRHFLDHRRVKLPSDIHEENCTNIKRFLVGLKSQTVITFPGHFNNRKSLSRMLEQFPPIDKFILLSNAADKKAALEEADKVLINYILSDGKTIPGNLYHRDFGEAGIQLLNAEKFEERKNLQHSECREFFQSLC